MIFSRYNFFLILQVIFLALTPAAFAWTIQQEYMLVTSSSLVVLWVGQIIYLIWYMQKINRDIGKFITAIRFGDTSIHFKKEINKDRYFNKIYNELNEIINSISEIRSLRESEYQFFQYTIKHIATGIIAFDETGKIEICNNAVLQILNLPLLKEIADFDKCKAGLSVQIKNLQPGTTKLIKIGQDNISIKAADFRIKTRSIKLVSLQNINHEIDQNEIEAWQKLIRILTHEIMNSVSPINLLSGSLIDLFEENEKLKLPSEIDSSTINDTILGLKTIRKRSTGLSGFVENYKSLTQLPKPVISEFPVIDLFKRIGKLMEGDLKKHTIEFILKCNPENILLTADEKLIEQVIINLIKNSIESLSGTNHPKITLTAETFNKKIQIKVSDNGCGIPPEIIDSIFIPFFTTKEKGSGIGLSLSRQIMHLHGGSISVKSEPYNETYFTLQF